MNSDDRDTASEEMRADPISTPYFAHDGRGPSLIRWLYDSDLFFDGTFFEDVADCVTGAVYAMTPLADGSAGPFEGVAVIDPATEPRCWVVFEGLQVYQNVPEEVHSYWHIDCETDRVARTGVWRVNHSEWLGGFDQRHLATSKHFILEFYDELVEVIADELVFGTGEFVLADVIDSDERFSYAYLRRAEVREKRGDVRGAIQDYESYARMDTDMRAVEYAQRCAEKLRSGTCGEEV